MTDLNRFRAATPADLPRLFPALPKKLWRGLAAQISAFPAFVLEHAGEPVAICSIVPAAGETELCLVLPPGRKLPLSALRHLMMVTATILPDRRVAAWVSDANPAGRRLATLIGFVPTEAVMPPGVRRWVRLTVTDGERP